MRRLALALLVVALLAPAGAVARAQLTVYAAASLTDVFPKIDRTERYSFGGSNALAAQIHLAYQPINSRPGPKPRKIFVEIGQFGQLDRFPKVYRICAENPFEINRRCFRLPVTPDKRKTRTVETMFAARINFIKIVGKIR